ncbi:hypothetical protein [Kocuria flava]|uniref:hypothetical protein n=1 Tax=Kocuria flava TaxID=446860 RepID=UPI002F9318F6
MTHHDKREQDTVQTTALRIAGRLVNAIHEHDEQEFYRALRAAFSDALPNLAPAVLQTLAAEVAAHQRLLLGAEDARESTKLALLELDLKDRDDMDGVPGGVAGRTSRHPGRVPEEEDDDGERRCQGS